MIKPRYEMMTEDIIKYYHHIITVDISIKEIRQGTNIQSLKGGRVNQVYRVDDEVIKIAMGKYRMAELYREYEIMNQMKQPYITRPKEYKDRGDYSYLIYDYIEGIAVANLETVDWKMLGQLLSVIHKEQFTGDSNWLDEQLKLAALNHQYHTLDLSEFHDITPDETLKWLHKNKPQTQKTVLLHGDFRPKNIIIHKNQYKVIDWGFYDIGDPYYDLAIIDYYFKKDENRNSFYKGYNRLTYDKALIDYYTNLSKFINV